MAAYLVSIVLQDSVTGIINCCSGEPVKVKDLVEQYIKASGSEIRVNLGYYPYPDYEAMEFWGDTTLLKKVMEIEKI